MLDAVPGGAEIVHQHDLVDFEFIFEDARVHHPRKIGGADVIVDHRTGDAETGGDDAIRRKMRGGLAREFLNDQVEGREFLASKALLEDRGELPVLLGKKRKVTLRATDISRKDHLFPQVAT